MSAFIVLRADRAASPVAVGAAVYTCKRSDYGCADEDTRLLHLAHVSVTLDPEGDYPFFTIPREDLAEAPPPATPALSGGSHDEPRRAAEDEPNPPEPPPQGSIGWAPWPISESPTDTRS